MLAFLNFIGKVGGSVGDLFGRARNTAHALDLRTLPSRRTACRLLALVEDNRPPWSDDQDGWLQCAVKQNTSQSAEFFLQPLDAERSFQWRDRALPMGQDALDALCDERGVSKWDAARVLFAARDFYDRVFAQLASQASTPAEKALQASKKMEALFNAWTVSAASSLDVLDQVQDTLTEIGAVPLYCSVEEADTLDVDSIQLELRWVYRRRVFRVAKSEAFAPQLLSVTVQGDAIALLLGLAARRGVEIRVPQWILSQASVPVDESSPGKLTRRTYERDSRSDAGWLGDQVNTLETLSVPPVEDLSVEQVKMMKPDQIRRLLAKNGVPTKSRATLDQLVASILPYLDETQRRRIQIEDAVDAEDYNEAAKLSGSKSRRHLVMDNLEEAVANGRYLEADKLKQELEILTNQRADPTQDEGSYDPYLDQDDWYRPNR